jgi:Dyp-type peroxidase family
MSTPAPFSTPAPTLDFTNIQGDVLQGLPKKYETFLFFDITNPTQFRYRLKAIIPYITTTAQALADQDAINEHKSKRKEGLLKLVGTNIAFSQSGLTLLGITDDLKDPLFTAGQLADASASFAEQGLGDPGVVTGTKTDPAWEPAFKKTIHGCILITGESKHTIAERLKELENILVGTFKTIIKVEGNVRPGAESGHEHFGFQDGLSQPAVIGFRQPFTGEAPTEPGVILLNEQGDGITTRPAWAKDSSFLVFRKLQQFVPEFNEFLAKNPIPDKGLTPAQGSELLGARLVGRWKSGAPIDRDPKADNLVDAADPNKRNDFDYSDDPNQLKCPFTAHLRKMNPRASKVPGLAAVQVRRIIRQGIPYGPEVDREEAHSCTTKLDRGLLFACYQSNLANGFHFLQRTWGNNPGFPNAGDGYDGIIGQDINDPRTTTGMDPQNVASSLALPKQEFVVPRGGEYFLVPSISALKTKFAD